MKQNYYLGLSEEGFHRVAYTEWGEPNGKPPMFCVHGLTRNGRDFDNMASFFSTQGEHVFCPDIVGRGESDWLKNPLHYTYEQYLADLNTLIARAGSDQINWLGTSLGGLLGMILASKPNTPIKKLILNDVGPQIPTKGLMRLSAYAGKDPDFSSFDDALRYYKSALQGMGPLTDDQWHIIVKNTIRETLPGKFIAKTDHGVKFSQPKSSLAWKAVMHPLKAVEGSLFDIDLWQIWRKVKCPVLVIHGKQSDILLPDILEKMCDIHPDTEVYEIENTGHAPPLLNLDQHEKIYKWLAA